jgi:hypothetical protein
MQLARPGCVPLRLKPTDLEISFSIGERKFSRASQLTNRGCVRGEDCGLSVSVLRSENRLGTLPCHGQTVQHGTRGCRREADGIRRFSHMGGVVQLVRTPALTQEAAASSPGAPAIHRISRNIGSHLCQENSFRASDRSNKTRATRGTRTRNRGKLC